MIFVPLLALTVGIGRWMMCKGELQKAADLAALAAAQEVDIPRFRDSGEIVLKVSAFSVARQYGALNSGYLYARSVVPAVRSVTLDQRDHTVRVVMQADVSSFFPEDLPDVVITARGTAQVRGLRH